MLQNYNNLPVCFSILLTSQKKNKIVHRYLLFKIKAKDETYISQY